MHPVQNVSPAARDLAPPPALLTVSGTIPAGVDAEIGAGERPQLDYKALAAGLPADLLDVPGARKVTGWFGRLLERIGGKDLLMAWACFCLRSRYAVLFTDGEHVGLLLALLLKFLNLGARPRHLMIAHILSVKKKMVLLDYLRLHSHIDTFFVYSSYQERFIRERWRLSDERVVWTPFMVDTRFYSPALAAPSARTRPMICAVGREARDYDTLLAAVAGLPIDVVIVAGSLWSKQTDGTTGRELPPNVTLGRYTYPELRQIYADSALMVMPLQPVTFQAGITAILEAMAMGKAVICSRVPGQNDVVVEGKTGLYVPPGDAMALRAAIEYLVANPAEAEAMGQAGRRRVEQEMSLDLYVERLRRHVEQEVGGKRPVRIA